MDILKQVNDAIWGIPVITLIVAVGLYLSIKTGFAQLRLLPDSLRMLLQRIREPNNQSSFRALCTALAATVGTGNIAGVAGAIAIGGPGSVFWMWVCAIFGMITKYAEALLSVRFRKRRESGEFCGGPMYIIEKGLGKRWHPLAVCYSLFGVIAAYGIGNATQVNAVVGSAATAVEFLNGNTTKLGNLLIGIILAATAVVALKGGSRRVGEITELLVPTAAAVYLVLCLGALLCHWQSIPSALNQILCGAFTPHAVTGGAIGSCAQALRVGAARGVFTNEAGMGTAAIAHGTANVKHPAQQGLMGIIEVFLDTIVICTMTALVILTSGVLIPYGVDEGAALTSRAFACTYGPWISIPIALFLAVFAFATILGWGFYGLQCIEFLFGKRAGSPYILMMGIVTLLSTFVKTGDIWVISELVNGLMAIPNLIAVALLSGTVTQLTWDFIQGEHRTQASGKNLPEGNRWRRVRCRGRGSQESFHR